MAAVIDLRTGSAVTHGPRPGASVPSRRPEFRVIQGGRSDQALRLRRTYLRRRALAAVVLLGFAALAVVATSSVLAGLGAAAAPEVVVSHRVERGDTLWSVAAAADPTGDPRDVIARIVELNSTAQASFSAEAPLRVGQELRVPSSRS